MNSKRYLMIVEKPSIKVLMKRIIGMVDNSVDYDIDVEIANNFVFDINDKYIIHDDNRQEMSQYPALQLKGKNVEDCFRIITDRPMYKETAQRITTMVSQNHYDAIINACDMDEQGDLMFEYVRESLALEEYPVLRLNMTALTDDYLAQELLSLHI